MSSGSAYNFGIPKASPNLGQVGPKSTKPEYLRDLPLAWLSDASDLFSQTMQLGGLMTGPSKSLVDLGVSGGDAGEPDSGIKDVVHGKKEVPVPPGRFCSRCLH